MKSCCFASSTPRIGTSELQTPQCRVPAAEDFGRKCSHSDHSDRNGLCAVGVVPTVGDCHNGWYHLILSTTCIFSQIYTTPMHVDALLSNLLSGWVEDLRVFFEVVLPTCPLLIDLLVVPMFNALVITLHITIRIGVCYLVCRYYPTVSPAACNKLNQEPLDEASNPGHPINALITSLQLPYDTIWFQRLSSITLCSSYHKPFSRLHFWRVKLFFTVVLHVNLSYQFVR